MSRPAGIDPDLASDFKELGVNVAPEAIASKEEAFDVWRVNWKTVISFVTLETQWRVVSGHAGLTWLGLDYAAAAAVFQGRSHRVWQRLLSELRIMEHAALEILNAERPS